MKILTLLRHAKSAWDDPVSRDFDRQLNKRGRSAARLIGRAMREQNLAFDAVIASPAVRVVETLREVGEGYGRAIEAKLDPGLYLASPTLLLDRVHHIGEEIERLLLVGHNPGLEQLALLLGGRDPNGLRREVEIKYPTATLAEIHFALEDWRDVAKGGGTITRFIRPRDLDSALGPED